jgi:hypothetical protein
MGTRNLSRASVASLAALATAAAVHAQPKVMYVDAHAVGIHDGTTWQSAFRDLQDALYAASVDPQRAALGIEIHISQGVYTADHGTLNPLMSFTLASAVTLMGGFAGLLGANPNERDPGRFATVLSGDLDRNDAANFTNYAENTRTIIRADVSNVLDGLEISGGNADSTGVGPGSGSVVQTIGYLAPGASLTIRNCSIVRNRGVTSPVCSLVRTNLTACRISGNRAQNTSVIQGRDLAFKSCEIRGNQTVYVGSNQTIATILFRQPSGTGPSSFVRCLIADNTGGALGAIYAYETGLDITIDDCTIADNAAPNAEAITSIASLVRIRNSIIAGNVRSTLPATHTQVAVIGPFALDADGTVLIDNGAAGIRYVTIQGAFPPVLGADPRFVSPGGADNDPATWADNDYHLRAGSPAIDRADSSQTRFAPVDLEGVPLYDDPYTANAGTGPFAYADLGAYEYTGAVCPADFDHSGTVDVTDIFGFLNAWFAGNPATDFDHSGSLGPADILAFLNAWLGGC